MALPHGCSVIFPNKLSYVSGIFRRIVTFPVDFQLKFPMDCQWQFPMDVQLSVLACHPLPRAKRPTSNLSSLGSTMPLQPMKSEPPTPTRAPDNQLYTNIGLTTFNQYSNNLLNFWAWGRGFLFHRWPCFRGGCPAQAAWGNLPLPVK